MTLPGTTPHAATAPALPSLEAYAHFLDRLDDLLAEAWQQYGGQMACKAGCFACCKNDFKVSVVEAEAVKRTVAQLPLETQRSIEFQLAEPNRALCPLLIEGQCSVYEQRPVLCRIFGFPVTDGTTLSTCELNFTDERADEFSGQAFDTRKLAETTEFLSALYLADSGQPLPLNEKPPMKRLAEWLSSGFS